MTLLILIKISKLYEKTKTNNKENNYHNQEKMECVVRSEIRLNQASKIQG